MANSTYLQSLSRLRHILVLISLFSALSSVVGCSSIYFSALEKIGIDKRELVLKRVRSTRASQEETKKQFSSALDKFSSVLSVDGGSLEVESERFINEMDGFK